MQVVVSGKNLELTDEIQNYAEQKVGKLDRFLDNIIEASLVLTQEHTRSTETRFVARITMFANGTTLRGEERAGDLYTAIDAVTDLMQKEMLHYKEKQNGRGRAAASRSGAKVSAATVASQLAGEEAISRQPTEVVKAKRFTIKSMDIDEAIEQMELISHDFFVYLNATTDEVSIVYKRKNGTYGLIEPEFQ